MTADIQILLTPLCEPTGNIPAVLGNLTNLEELYLNSNELSGKTLGHMLRRL